MLADQKESDFFASRLRRRDHAGAYGAFRHGVLGEVSPDHGRPLVGFHIEIGTPRSPGIEHELF